MFHFEINVLHTSQAPFETYFNAIFNNEIGKILFWVEIKLFAENWKMVVLVTVNSFLKPKVKS